MAGALGAVAGAGTETSSATQAALESKTRLVALLLAQSPAMQRIPESGNAQAKKMLADAQTLYAQANAEASAGHKEQAVKLLDQALLELVSAARLVPDPMQLAAQERARYTSQSETVRTFLTLHGKLSARMAERKVQAPGGSLDLGKVGGLVEKAEALAGAGNHKDANAALNEAYRAVVVSLNRMLMAETIVYDQKFASPAEEFQNELARNRSYEELVPLALVQLNTARESAQLSERYVQQSRELREAAQKQAAVGDYAAALKTIQDATGHLQRSLRIAGVIVPQAPQTSELK
jgi:hypothetical protein